MMSNTTNNGSAGHKFRRTPLKKENSILVRLLFGLIQYNATLRLKAYLDPLTGVCNASYLRERLHQEFARAKRYGRDLSLLFLDIDEFKAYNDAHGHQFGNKVLVRVATVVRESVRSNDVVTRFGGEEFVVILPETGLQGALVAAERIQDKISRDASYSHYARVTVSIGVSHYPSQATTKEELLKKADMAMYKAKTAGKNKIMVIEAQHNPITSNFDRVAC